jgi:hypothetical protein
VPRNGLLCIDGDLAAPAVGVRATYPTKLRRMQLRGAGGVNRTADCGVSGRKRMFGVTRIIMKLNL